MKGFNIRFIAVIILVVVAASAMVLWLIPDDEGEIITRLPRNVIENSIHTDENVNVTLVAREPDVINPMTLCVDRSGAIYVSESFTYRYGLKGSPSQDTLTLNPIKRIELGPDGKLSKVTVVAAGFVNPVMGIDIFKDKLYATCLNELFVMDIAPDGKLSNKQVLVKDAAIPWNPFGMYRVAVGPDAKLWLAMADHPDSKPVELTGTDGSRVQLRGQSGGFVRCNLDGSNLELVVQGFRAPFAFDFDPWGHLWAISNGERSPNIYVDVIPGMDYGYHSRNVSYAWLAGKTNLAPPVSEMGSGANTVALHYYSSMFPTDDFWGSILIANWGSHGAYPTNRTIKHFIQQALPIADSVKKIGERFGETANAFVTSSDSMFRPVGSAIAPDGAIYLADWHGQDDESDSTGRIFRFTHIGQMKKSTQYDPVKIAAMEVKQLSGLLGNHNKFIRLDAQQRLVQMGAPAIVALEKVLRKGDAFEAANAVWTLVQMQDSSAVVAMSKGLQHNDARVRALTLRQLRQAAGQPIGGLPGNNQVDTLITKGKQQALITPAVLQTWALPLIKDRDQEVRVEAALAQNSMTAVTSGLLSALDIASTKRIRYRIGFELGRYGDSAAILTLYDSTAPAKYNIALIAAQTALTENTALATVVKDWDLSKDENFAKDWVAKIEAGKPAPTQTADMLLVLEWLGEHPRESNPALTAFLIACLEENDYLVKLTTLELLRHRQLQNELLKDAVQQMLRGPADPLNPSIAAEVLYTMGSFPDPGPASDWLQRIKDADENGVVATLRALRQHSKDTAFIRSIWPDVVIIAKKYPQLAEEFWASFNKPGFDTKKLAQLPKPPSRPTNAPELTKWIMATPGADQRGRWTFNVNCMSCHSTRMDDGEFRLGPNLSNIGSASQPEYFIESILEPSKVLKTGYQIETIETADGKTYNGQVETRGEDILIRQPGTPSTVVPMAAIKKRTTSHISPMPEGLHHTMTVRELADITAYLKSLKGN